MNLRIQCEKIAEQEFLISICRGGEGETKNLKKIIFIPAG